ncbi:MAG: hypothetical protein ACPGUV_04990, partial [Polyangiales bacterium]
DCFSGDPEEMISALQCVNGITGSRLGSAQLEDELQRRLGAGYTAAQSIQLMRRMQKHKISIKTANQFKAALLQILNGHCPWFKTHCRSYNIWPTSQ